VHPVTPGAIAIIAPKKAVTDPAAWKSTLALNAGMTDCRAAFDTDFPQHVFPDFTAIPDENRLSFGQATARTASRFFKSGVIVPHEQSRLPL
jgi:hypothetical protein